MLRQILKILVFNQFLSVLTFQNLAEIKGISTALSDVISEVFVQPAIKFDFVVLGENSHGINDVLNQVRRNSSSNFSTQISHIKSKMSPYETNLVVFARSSEQLKQSFDVEHFEFPDGFFRIFRSYNFLFFIEGDLNLTKLTIRRPNPDYGHISQYSYFLIKKNKQIQLMTIEWWTEKSCNQEQHVILNTFDVLKLKWEKPLNVGVKFKNFHGCQLKSYTSIFPLPFFDKALMKSDISEFQINLVAQTLGIAKHLKVIPQRDEL